MKTKNVEALKDLIHNIKQGKIKIDAKNNYSPSLEPAIQEAVSFKRSGNYDRAVEIYLDIFSDCGCVNNNIVTFLYKVVLCAEEFSLAYEMIVVSENEAIRQVGPLAPLRFFPGGPVFRYVKWAQTDYKEELLEASRQTLLTGNTSALLEYVRSKSGNASYRFTKSNTQIISEISQLF